FVFAIDGPSGSGKSTTARLVAARLGLRHVDTGAMYRAVTLCAREAGVDTGDGSRLGELARSLSIDFAAGSDGPAIRVGNRDVTADIRSPEVTAAVSAVSAHPEVRAAMVQRQRELSRRGSVILEGRDIGSVVLPWADVKVYLDASLHVRAERRFAELARAGVRTTVEDVERDLARRDTLDTSREASPLVCPVGAWVVDTSAITIDAQVERVIELATDAARERSPAGRTRPPQRRKRFIYRSICAFVAAVYHVVFGMRVRRIFRPAPGENYLFASNHRAYSDPPAVSCRLPREVHFVAKDSLFRLPVLGPLIRYLNAFPIRREMFDREAMAHAAELLSGGKSVLIFPEGGRVHSNDFGKARSGVGYLAIQTGVPVVPVYVEGTNHLDRCLLRRCRFRVIQGPPIHIPAALAERYRQQDDRTLYRRHSEMVMAAIRALRDGAS
ncbi:MAG TPA: (d)CMP kinase, partial [Candidatus Krumholzibacteria bacterium]|nr:(d)CMP kinase [Candidatus Krumholzibacteria bacterium]